MKHAIRIANRRTYFVMESLGPLKPYFSYRAPGYFYAPAYRLKTWDGFKCLIKNGSVPTGLFLHQRALIEKKLKLDLFDERTFPKFRKKAFTGGTPHPFQVDCLRKMVEHSNTGGTIINATGTGKTFLAAMYFNKIAGNATFIVDEKTLGYQSQEELSKLLGEEVGFIGDGKWKPKRITVALIQTLNRNFDDAKFVNWLKESPQTAVFIDELHMALNDRSELVVSRMRPFCVFGLTATLEMQKLDIALRATAIAGEVIYRFPYNEAVKEKVLVPGVVVGVDLIRSHPLKKWTAPELYEWFICDNERRNTLIADLAREGIKRGRHVAILVDLPKHVRVLSAMLQDVPHNTVFGARSVGHRLKAKKNFEQDRKQLLIANRVFKKGINIKILDAIIDGAAMANVNDAGQKFGRGVRTLKGKDGLIYMDIGDRKSRKSAFPKNKFTVGTKRRRKMFRESQIGVTALLAKRHTPAAIWDHAEKELAKVVAKQ